MAEALGWRVSGIIPDGTEVLQHRNLDERYVAARQRAKTNILAFDAVAQERLGNLRGKVKPIAGMGNEAFMQLWTRLHRPQSHCSLGKSVTTRVLEDVKVNPRAQGRLVRFEINTHGLFANECQSSVGGQIVGSSFYKKDGPVPTHLKCKLK